MEERNDECGQSPNLQWQTTDARDAHLQFRGDIYDQLLLVSFVKRIRGEQKFDSPEELAAQLKEDEQTVLDLFEKEAE